MNSTHPYEVATIADELLKIGKSRGETMSPMKLNKMVYVAHGWFLGMYDRKLIRNRIEAWKFGPVIPDLYRATKSYGKTEIPLERIGNPDDTHVELEVRTFLESVYDTYGHLTAIDMSALTHRSCTPWDLIHVKDQPEIENPTPLIKSYYKEMLDDWQQAESA